MQHKVNSQAAIQLLVGLGNPGLEYAATRHNAGTWFVLELAKRHAVSLRAEAKFHGLCGLIKLDNCECRLLLPTTYMNNSGQAVQAIANFYKIPVNAVLVVHDDLDFPPGIVRLKFDGGHGGHKGLQSTTQYLQSKNFYRIRIGIGHPGHKDLVHDYVLQAPSRSDKKVIMQSIEKAVEVIPELLQGEIEKAQNIINNG